MSPPRANQQMDRTGETEAVANDLRKWVALQIKGSVLKKGQVAPGLQLLKAALHAFCDPAAPVRALVVIADAVSQLVPLLKATQNSPTPLPHDKALQLTQQCVQLMDLAQGPYKHQIGSCPEVRVHEYMGHIYGPPAHMHALSTALSSQGIAHTLTVCPLPTHPYLPPCRLWTTCALPHCG